MFLPSLSRVTFIANYLFRLYILGDEARPIGLQRKPKRIDFKDRTNLISALEPRAGADFIMRESAFNFIYRLSLPNVYW